MINRLDRVGVYMTVILICRKNEKTQKSKQ